jgi:FtsP/CotA-like multicopper oxidase with cupredoxin domain
VDAIAIAHRLPLMLSRGQRIGIELVNRSMTAHPIRLHGHAFQVIAIDGRAVQGAVRETCWSHQYCALSGPAFNADNPGWWAFHCHCLDYMATGVMAEFRYHGISA